MLNYKLFLAYIFPSLDCSLLQSGWHACAPSHSYGPTARDYYLIHYIVKGKGVLIKNNKEYRISKGQGFLISPGEVTFYRADEADPWEYLWVGFKGINCQKYMSLCSLGESNPVFSYNEDGSKTDLILQNIQSINNLDKTNMNYNYLGIGYLYLIFGELMGNNVNCKQKSKGTNLIFKALEYIETHYASEFTISDLAKHLFIDRTYLFRLFEKYVQKGPTQYILDYRLSKSCEFLTNTNFKISMVAQLAGFTDISYFGRTFKQKYSVTPFQYRKNPPKNTEKKDLVYTFDLLTNPKF